MGALGNPQPTPPLAGRATLSFADRDHLLSPAEARIEVHEACRDKGLGFRVLGFGALGLQFGLGCLLSGFGLGAWGFGLWAWGFGAWGLGFRVWEASARV